MQISPKMTFLTKKRVFLIWGSFRLVKILKYQYIIKLQSICDLLKPIIWLSIYYKCFKKILFQKTIFLFSAFSLIFLGNFTLGGVKQLAIEKIPQGIAGDPFWIRLESLQSTLSDGWMVGWSDGRSVGPPS